MLLWLLIACTPPSGVDALEACSTLDCQQRALGPALDADPAATLDWVREQRDPLTQVALVTTIGSRDPGLLVGVCATLSPEAAQRCDRFVERPHLQQPVHSGPPPGTRPAGGPAGTSLMVPPQPALVGDPATRADVGSRCARDSHCVQQAARDAGAALDAAAAEAACQILSSGDLSADECRFQAAESAVATAGIDGLSTALALCAASAFDSDCLIHSLALTLPPSVAADAVDPQAVADMRGHVERLGQIMGGGAAAAQAVDLAWNLWICAAYGVGSPGPGPLVRGDLLDHLPAEAAPHVRFAAASRVAMTRPEDPVEALALATEHALAQRGQAQPGAARRPVVVPRIGGHLWAGDLPGEEQVPATWARGPTRRPTSTDPTVDMQLAVISAMAMNPGRLPPRHLLALIGDEAVPEHVRWAAAMTVGGESPRVLAEWAQRNQDSSSLVQGRLSWAAQQPARGRRGR